MRFPQCGILLLLCAISGSASGLLMLRKATVKSPVVAIPSSISLDSVHENSFEAPNIQDYKVEPITADNIPLLQELAEESTIKKQQNKYSSLSEDDLAIDVRMPSIESPLRYFITPPPSTCSGATGPAAKLLDCATTFPRIVIDGV
jgi:hypothetical protein